MLGDWPFKMPAVGDDTKYGEVVVIVEDLNSRYVDWLEPAVEIAQERGLSYGTGEEIKFFEALEVDFFPLDYGTPWTGGGTAFIGVKTSLDSRKEFLKKAMKAAKEFEPSDC